jgi:hypothetical protein
MSRIAGGYGGYCGLNMLAVSPHDPTPDLGPMARRDRMQFDQLKRREFITLLGGRRSLGRSSMFAASQVIR